MTLQSLPASLELPVLQPRRKPHRYGPDNPPPGKGRTKGAINKITADLKQGILRGAEACGYDGEGLGGIDGFLLMCAQRHPKHYLALLGRLMPLQAVAEGGGTAITQVNVISVPSGSYLSEEDIARMQIPQAEHVPQEAFSRVEEYPVEAETDAPAVPEEPHVVMSEGLRAKRAAAALAARDGG